MTQKNNRGIIITLIVLLSTIVILLSAIMIYAICGGSLSLLKNHYSVMENSQIIYDESYSADQIKDIVIRSAAGDITVKSSSDDTIRITAKGYNSDLMNVSSDNEALIVKSESLNKSNMNWFSNSRTHGVDIELYIPENLNSLDIASQFGDVEIDSRLITDLKISTDYGDIKAKYLEGSFDLHTDLGDIDIDQININSQSSATTDLGDIDIHFTNNIKIEGETSLGNCDIKNSDSRAEIILTAKTDLGDIEIN
ncbi:MAG: DUF4097 domain-containing protein [Clostridium sp.]|nr:DUF4097 domain-containing protein [Clostridium sp.]